MKAFYAVLCLIASAHICNVAVAAKDIPPAPKHYVYDETGLITKKTEEILDQTLYEHEKATTEQLVFAVFKSLDGEDPVDFTNRIFSAWKPGKRGKDNGILVAVYWLDRKIRIEVGYGLEPTVTDADSKRVISDVLVPALKSGDLNYALITGTQALLDELESPLTKADQSRLALAQAVKQTRVSKQKSVAPILFFLILIIGFILYLSQSVDEHFRGSGWRKSRNVFPFPMGGGFGGGGFGGFGGGGFGGGGGRSGGGGASGSW